MTRPSESEKRQKLLKAMFAGIGDGCYIEPSFHANLTCFDVCFLILFSHFSFSASSGVFKKIKKIECAVGYIKQNYHRPDLKISDLVVLSGMSDKNLRRIFSEVYHITPHEFLREFRINKAKILLLHTQETITNIALQCGFSDVYSFSHCFKSLIGISPKGYRNGEY